MKKSDDIEQESLNDQKLRIEIEKLKLEIKKGERPWFFQTGFITLIIGIILTGSVNWLVNGKGIEAQHKLKEINLKEAERKLKEEEIKISQLKIEVDAKKNKIQKNEMLFDNLNELISFSIHLNSLRVQAKSMEAYCNKVLSKLDSIANQHKVVNVKTNGLNTLKGSLLKQSIETIDVIKSIERFNFVSEKGAMVFKSFDSRYIRGNIENLKKLENTNLHWLNDKENNGLVDLKWSNELSEYKYDITRIKQSCVGLQGHIDYILIFISSEFEFASEKAKEIVK